MKIFAEVLKQRGVIRHVLEFPEELGTPQYSEESGLEAIDITALDPRPSIGWVRAADGSFGPPLTDHKVDFNPPSNPLPADVLALQANSDPTGALDWLNDPANVSPDELAALRANVWGGLLVQALAVEDFSNLQKFYVKLKETTRDPLSGDRVLYFGKEFLTLFRLPLRP